MNISDVIKKPIQGLSVSEQMKIASQQLKEQMNKLSSIGNGMKMGIGAVDYSQNFQKEGWSKFL